MITIVLFIALWICTAKDIKYATGLTYLFLMFIGITAVFNIGYIYLLPIYFLFVITAICALLRPWPEYHLNKKRTWKKRWIKNPREVIAYRIFAWIFMLLPLPWLSWVGGKALETFGPLLKKRQRIIENNLSSVLPQYNNKKFIKQIWNTWGRAFVEGLKYKKYFHSMNKYITVKNWELAQRHKQYILAMPHMAGMEFMALPFAANNMPIAVTYKFPSNPLSNNILLSSYGLNTAKNLYFVPVGNAMPMVRALRNGDILNINLDQRIHGAPYIDFMGIPARTSTGSVQLARKFNLPIVVGHVCRTHGAHHEIVFDEIITPDHTDDAAADEINTTKRVNDAFGRAIATSPADYLWMHQRWA